MHAKLSSLEALPTEVLESIISTFPTAELVALATISQRFYTLVADSLYMRLLHRVALPGYEIILECYAPGQKKVTPVFYCKYLGTNGLDLGRSGAGTPTISTMGDGAKSISNLLRLYSRFRPAPVNDARTQMTPIWVRNPAIMPGTDTASQLIQLDGGELFSQLVVDTILAKHGEKHALLANDVRIHKGFLRIWRDWMSARCSNEFNFAFHALGLGDDEVECMDQDSAILWVDSKRHIGLRFKVMELTPRHESIPGLSSDDMPVSYRLECEELLIRSCRLVMSAEEAEIRERSSTRTVMAMALM